MSDPNTPRGGHAKHDVDNPTTIFVVFLGVIGLSALNIGISVAGVFGKYALLAQLLIGTVQAALVGLYWMHLKKSDRVVVLTALASIFWLGIAFVLILSDFFTRHRPLSS